VSVVDREFLKVLEVSPEREIMTTMLLEQLAAGDVIEVKSAKNLGDDVVTALVLLATDEFVILDPCDDTTPMVVSTEELVEYRKFDPTVLFDLD
jgi:hypothetical protein